MGSEMCIRDRLMSVGRDVRSTPMKWAYEGKKLDTCVKYMSWRPPWARGESDGDVDYDLLGENLLVYDLVGRGRAPAFWFTLNCGWRGYNSVYDIHRLNVGAALASEAVAGAVDVAAAVRRAFVREARHRDVHGRYAHGASHAHCDAGRGAAFADAAVHVHEPFRDRVDDRESARARFGLRSREPETIVGA